jgi:hypothetical protein
MNKSCRMDTWLLNVLRPSAVNSHHDAPKHRRSVLRVLLMVMVLLSMLPKAQASDIRELDVIILEQQFDGIIAQSLAKYFETDLFLVAVRIEMKSWGTPKNDTNPAGTVVEEQSADTPRRTLQQLPGLPIGNRTRPRMRPAQPTAQTGENPSNTEQTTTETPPQPNIFDVQRIMVQIVADTSLSAADLDFMLRVAQMALKFNAARGDVVDIVQLPIPIRMQRQTQNAVVRQDQETANGPGRTPEWSWSTILNDLWNQNPVQFILLSLLALTVVIFISYLLLRSRKRNIATPETGSMLPEMPSYPRLQPPVSNNELAQKSSTINVGKVISSDIDNRVGAVQYLLNIFLSFPDEVGRLFDFWIIQDSIYGAEKTVAILQQVDPKFLPVFRKYMSEDNFEQISRLMYSRTLSTPNRSAIDMIQTLANDIHKRIRFEDGTAHLAILQNFDFLMHLDRDTLATLLTSQSDETIALVFNQIGSRRTLELIPVMDAMQVQQVVPHMARVREMDYSTFEHIADNLFKIYRDQFQLKSFNSQDIAQTVHILEMLPIDQQNMYLIGITDEDADFARAIKMHLINAASMSSLPEHLLDSVIDTMNIQELALAMAHAKDTLPQEFTTRLIRFRNDREQRLIFEIMQSAQDYPEYIRSQAFDNLIFRLRKKRNETIFNKNMPDLAHV